MEVGYRLIPMVDFQQDGELLGRIRSIRKKFAQEMGFLPPVVHIRDNMDLQPARYRILMKGNSSDNSDNQSNQSNKSFDTHCIRTDFAKLTERAWYNTSKTRSICLF